MTIEGQPDIIQVIEREGISLRREGKLYVGNCPFHDDSTPSMKVFPNNNSFYCFGCHVGGDALTFIEKLHGMNFKDACKHLGIEVESGTPAVKQRVVETFTYTDGVNTYYKDRLEPGKNGRTKEFRQWSMKDGERQYTRGCDPRIYNGDRLKTAKAVVFMEGEKKADIVNSWGIPGVVAVCLDAGSGSPWRAEYTDALRGKDKLVILPDNDDPGEKYAAMVAQQASTVVAEIKIVRLPDLAVKGDVIDWVRSGGTKEAFIDLVKTSPVWAPDAHPLQEDSFTEATLATYNGPGRIVTSWEKLDQLHAEKKFEPTICLKTKIPGLDVHIRDCRGGQLVIVSGDEGEGKSLGGRTLTSNFAEQEARCLWFSYEERPDEFLAKFGESVPYFLLPAELEKSTLTWITERIKEASAKYGTIHAVFIDHLHYLTDEVESGNLSNDLGRICRKLKLLAVNENLIIVLIVHTNRSEAAEEPTIRSLRDSGMIGKEADTVIFIWRIDGGNDAVLKVAKCRATGAKNKKVNVTKIGPFLREKAFEPEVRYPHAEKLKARREGRDD